MSSEALLPCPFCGATAHHGLAPSRSGQNGEIFQNYRIWCPHGHSQFEMPKAPAIAAWNRRATPSPASGELAWACVKCNSPRSVDPCPKCGTALTKPADGWEWPSLPDIDRIRSLAREVGYAIGVHGSLERDLDLIAAPWQADAAGPLELAEHIAYGLGGNVVDFERQDKPCGRWSCNIHTPDWTKMIDLSVMPPDLAASQLAAVAAERDALRDALKPSGETKAAYIGEFSFPLNYTDHDGNHATTRLSVPWTTIKEIMAAIAARATLSVGGGNG